MATLAERVAQFPADTPPSVIADALNAPDPANGMKRIPIDRKGAWDTLMARGAWPRLRLIAQGRRSITDAVPDEETLLEAVVGAVDQISREDTSLIDATSDADWSQLQQVLGLFVLNTTITKVDATHMQDILALGMAPLSEAEANPQWGEVTARTVGIARGGKP